MGDRHPDTLSRESRRYYRLHSLVVYSLLLALFCLPSRQTAWGGWSVAIVSLGAFFFYHFMTRAQLGLLEFIVTMMVLGHALLLTVKHVWPLFEGTEVDWFILPVTLGVAVWVLGGALWCGWVGRALRLKSGKERLHVLILGWLAPAAFPGLVVSLFLTFTGIPTYILQHIGLRKSQLAYAVYDWWVLLVPFTAVICYRVVAQACALHAGARALRPDDELIADAAHFGAPKDPFAPDPRAARTSGCLP